MEQENTEVIEVVNESSTESLKEESVSDVEDPSSVAEETISDDSTDHPPEDDSLEDKPTIVINDSITENPVPKKSKKSNKQKSLFRRNRHVKDTTKYSHVLIMILERNQN